MPALILWLYSRMHLFYPRARSDEQEVSCRFKHEIVAPKPAKAAGQRFREGQPNGHYTR